MTTRMTFDTVRPPEPPARGYKRMNARALFSALLGCLSWLPLSSAVEAAPFQQYTNGACASSSFCAIDFPFLPAGRRLDITNASCYVRTSGDAVFNVLTLLVADTTAVQTVVTLRPRFVDHISSPFESVYSANHSVFAFANAGQRFRAYAALKKGTFSQFACHISGQLRNLP